MVIAKQRPKKRGLHTFLPRPYSHSATTILLRGGGGAGEAILNLRAGRDGIGSLNDSEGSRSNEDVGGESEIETLKDLEKWVLACLLSKSQNIFDKLEKTIF